jgi:hypothetical protein
MDTWGLLIRNQRRRGVQTGEPEDKELLKGCHYLLLKTPDNLAESRDPQGSPYDKFKVSPVFRFRLAARSSLLPSANSE